MTLATILELIQGILTFPNECLALVRALKGTPEEQQETIMAQIQKSQNDFMNSGRPS